MVFVLRAMCLCMIPFNFLIPWIVPLQASNRLSGQHTSRLEIMGIDTQWVVFGVYRCLVGVVSNNR